MRQGNARIIVIHPFVFGLIFKKISVGTFIGTFRKTLVYRQNNVMLKLCSNLSNILFKGGQIMKLWKKGIILGMVVALAIVCVPEMYVKADEVPTVKASVISSANLIEDQ